MSPGGSVTDGSICKVLTRGIYRPTSIRHDASMRTTQNVNAPQILTPVDRRSALDHETMRRVCVARINALPSGTRARVDMVERVKRIMDYLNTRRVRKILKRAGGYWGLKPAILGKDV